MAMRGFAVTTRCPRCGHEAPPTDEPLAHCAECKLAFDPRAEHPARPERPVPPERELVAAPRGIAIERGRGEVTLRWSFDRVKGAALLVAGVLCTVVLLSSLDTPGESVKELVSLGVAAVGCLYVGLALAFGEKVLRIDAHALSLRRAPLPLAPARVILRGELGGIELAKPDTFASDTMWFLFARTRTGRVRIAMFDSRYERAVAAAGCIKAVIEEAVAEIPRA